MRVIATLALATSVLCLGAACSPTQGKNSGPVTAANHRWFPVGVGTGHEFGKVLPVDGAVTCDSCHIEGADSFTEFQCINCHKHPLPLTDRLHLGEATYAATSARCYECHPTGEKQAFSHRADPTGLTLITDRCAECHDVDNAFAALPVAGLTHPAVGRADCGGCHVTTTWKGAGFAPGNVSDPATDVSLQGLVPSFTATTITRVTPLQQTLPMPMNHVATALDPTVAANCVGCHLDAATGIYFPGRMHASLAGVPLPQPSRCAECHAPTTPDGFVGAFATAPARSPASGEMRHEAVAWNNGAPTTTRLVPGECALCHQTPDDGLPSTWATGPVALGGAPRYHASLTRASLPQPASCLDCHANSRPVTLLTSSNAALPVGLAFDHSSGAALGDCQSCHAGTTLWTGGTFHHAGGTVPTTCLPCHELERPSSTATWASTTYTRSPFDYVTNADGVGHGGDEDCAVCHRGAGTGTWGSTQNWQAGTFPHGAGTLAATNCIACHTTQRPTSVVQSFDHAQNGNGDCRACHQATVVAGRYVDYFNPGTGTLPGGDWKDGRAYPGDIVVTSSTQFLALTQYTLQRQASTGLVTGITSQSARYYNAMLHTSTAIPAQVFPGPVTLPDNTSCWHCHTHTNGTVTSYNNGEYHTALTNYRATPGGAVSALPQPTSRCMDCHESMRPDVIVERAASPLRPMDHSARFTASVMIGGQPTTTVATVDCSVCHASPGIAWDDGEFHGNIGAAVPADCTACHYPLMATTQADVTSGTTYVMKHRSPQLTFQKCDTCHTTALARGADAPVAATLWRTGGLHSHTTPQPATCQECHNNSEPANATQSTVTYALAMGATATNARQWMSHAVSTVTSRDCGACHAADAKTSNSAWSDSTAYHAVVSNPGACAPCHGTANGRGTTIGTNNNLPLGLTNSRMTTTTTAMPGVKDQLTHAEVNVTSRDCGFCHTQKGPSTVAGVQGQEWKQALFHRSFNASTPLVMNGTTGRCSACHMNVRPGASYTPYNHTALTNASGSTDCVSCHSWPGTGTPTAPNWEGAVGGAPVYISVGGFTVPQPPASSANTTAPGIANLPHPAGTNCSQCHTGGVGGKNAFGYDHALAPAAGCVACHETGSDLVGTVWNGTVAATMRTASCGKGSGSVRDREGDTRPIGITNIACGDKASSKTCGSRNCSLNHFYPIDCRECHTKPSAGVKVTLTGAAYVTAWRFPHTQGNMQATTCCKCHNTRSSGECKP